MNISYIYVAALGLSWIITNSYIFEPLRTKIEKIADDNPESKTLDLIDYFFNCIICMSMWTFIPFYGLAIWAFEYSLFDFFIYWFSTPVFVIVFNNLISFLNRDESP